MADYERAERIEGEYECLLMDDAEVEEEVLDSHYSKPHWAHASTENLGCKM